MNEKVNDDLRAAVIHLLSQSASGKPAADVVQRVVKDRRVKPDLVRRQLRTLIERGVVEVGPSLNLVIVRGQSKSRADST
jgi:Fe2+ or Zn2+ uptake regulation protein